MMATIEILVSYRLRTTGKIIGYPMTLPAGADPHLVSRRAVIDGIASATGVAPEQIELLDVDVRGRSVMTELLE